MKTIYSLILIALALSLIPIATQRVYADVFVQCPGDFDGDAVPETIDPNHSNMECVHLSAGDGFSTMADGRLQYVFGFANVTGIASEMVFHHAAIGAETPAPTLVFKEDQEVYLTLTNVGMMMRPDLFDPHTVHFHGFPNAAPIFDGMPDAAVSINMMSSLTYYYLPRDPGTYLYHCHVEATEHMQMGMLGNLYVLPAQDDLPDGTNLDGFIHHTGYHYAYNDGDGSTYYDVEQPLLITAFDPVFHDASMTVQPLPFADMNDKYAMFNGRGYPDTIYEGEIANGFDGRFSQKIPSLIHAQQGDRILLRVASLSTQNFYTVTVLGIPMTVIGKDARLLRGRDGESLYYRTNAVTLGGGETVDVILDTTDSPPGTYCIYTTNLNFLSNNTEDFGGLMTEIRIY